MRGDARLSHHAAGAGERAGAALRALGVGVHGREAAGLTTERREPRCLLHALLRGHPLRGALVERRHRRALPVAKLSSTRGPSLG